MSHPPLNLAAHDFDAYAAEKASSNAFTRPRIEVKQRALAWARGVVARLAELGIAVDVHGSDEHPSLRNKKRVDCQWVFFSRDEAARAELERLQGRGRSIADEIDDPSPFTRHAFLALRLDAAAVEVCFAVHPEAQVDVENLRARLAEAREDDASPLTAALRALPEQFSLGLSPDRRGPAAVGLEDPPGAERVAASAVTSEALQALLERAAAGQVPLWIGWSVARDTAVEHSALLDEQLADALVALAPIYRLIAWSRDNDRIALDRRIESAEQERARTHAEAEAETERWRAEQAEARRTAAEQARVRAAAHEPLPARSSSKPSLETLFGGARERSASPRPPSLPTGAARAHEGRPPPSGGPRSARHPSEAVAMGAPPPNPRAEALSMGAPPPNPRAEALSMGAPPPNPRAEALSMGAPPPNPRAEALSMGAPPPNPRAEAPASDRISSPAPRGARSSPPAPVTPERSPAIDAEKERTSVPSSPPVVEKGGKVRVLSGPFADKVGVVGELDGRGGARVLLGLLSTRLELVDLEPVVEGRERPSLQSSHRRPLAPAPRKSR